MIESININNYALIERTELFPAKGFSVITGETGAGKSILLGAIGLTLGQRADSSVIMDKSRKCVVEIVYHVGGYGLEPWFQENDLDYSEQVVVRREVTAEGKSRCFINDTPVSNKLLKDFGSFMVDIHSQHQSLLVGRPEYQTEALDAYCGNAGLVEDFHRLYLERKKIVAELKEMELQAADADKESDYLKFRFSQLENARLQTGEKEELEAELQLLTNAESIKSALAGISWNLRDTDNAVIQTLKNLRNNLESVGGVLAEAGEYGGRLSSVIIELNDLADEAERKAEGVEYNAERVEAVNLRLNVIYDLLFKYKAATVEELMELKEELQGKLEKLENGDEEIKALRSRLETMEKQMKALALDIRRMRMEAQEKLEEEMQRLLTELGIRHARFVVRIMPFSDFTPTGMDEVKFLFSANKNQEPGEISKVASGGEISRVMLALKYVLSKNKQLPVIIFDEIDTGLSGEVAHRMAKMMQEMALRMQVISISHLPQIAAAGNKHFKVYKEDHPETTISRIKELSAAERVREIAGMISGEEITSAALETAENLLRL
ncbi:MAG: DNA repair protein RecN [Odoribacter sp.]|nr:DNA repair protein RecN [Odoribacter sp.]